MEGRIMNQHQIVAEEAGRRTMRDIPRRCALALTLFAGVSALMPSVAHADDWGCQVILCLSDSGGPEQYGACVPPIERLWTTLRHGDPFPACDFGAGSTQMPYDPAQSATLLLQRMERQERGFGGGD
jgi:hypothetical protein